MVNELVQIDKMGYESFLYSPILSLVIGTLLFFGLISFGSFFLSFFFKKEVNNNNLFLLHSPLIGSNLLLAFLFPLTSLGLLNNNILKFTSYLLLILSIHFIKNILKVLLLKYKNNKTLLVLMFLLFLLCLAPFTHADTLDYHLLSAVNIINTGSFSASPIPLALQLEGAGEILIALSLAAGTEQFANLIQYGGLLSIIGSFLCIKKKNSYFLLLSVISTPCFIFFLSSPKPMLMQIANILFIFSYLFERKLKFINKQNFLFFSLIMLTINFLSKFSYIISSVFLFVYILIKLISKNYYKTPLFYIILVCFFLIFPDYYFNYKNFSTSVLNYMQSPLPINLPGFKEFSISLRHISDGSRILPLWLVVPNSLGMISTIIGPVILSFLLFEYKKINIYLFLIFVFLIFVLIFAQASSRFLFEGFVLLQFLLIFCNFKNKKLSIIFNNYVKFQSIVAICILAILVFKLLPGSFSYKSRNYVMINNANGYALIQWANNYLKKGDEIISTNRSLSLFNVPAYDLVTLQYIDFSNNNSEIFSKFIKEKKINKILIESDVNPGQFYNCTGKLIAKQENVGSLKGRNPFNQSKSYDASIYEFDYRKFPKCLF